ncbi:SprT family zinc-dependent metalloprotease [Bifidobacterium sp. ESL0745]|uniref:YgjP family zinc-dependent metalloprotease n=1 Tax=Bifidobacterium sp. ESL0745 TaxID=2983226 RepID=UPI0023F6E26E|nr:SprT family zinc-dependent metalloprotease [Bifidobacterium sp. ESL0745]MDF7665977.1 SprT family zinc-dependent metalloprotease [Bifidobacterium sp. ESL0745]
MPYRRRSKARTVSSAILRVDDLDVSVTRKTMRNMYLRVKPPAGKIEVSAPARMSDERIADFVRQRRNWIDEQRRRLQEAQRRIPYDFDGLQDLGTRGTQPDFDGNAIGGVGTSGRLAAGGNGQSHSAGFQWTDERKRLAQANINAQLPTLLERWGSVIGRKPTHITLRLMTSRWGSCTPATGRIRLNLQLGLMDSRFLEYVLVHEMTHLWASGHGTEFQRRMSRYLPNWRVLRRDLNREMVW